MKPDVLEQTKIIEENRKKMQQAQSQAQPTQGIMIQEPGKPPRVLSTEETLKIFQSNQQEIETLSARNRELEDTIIVLQNQILKLQSHSPPPPPSPAKSTPDIFIPI
jgi:hypothetical protein